MSVKHLWIVVFPLVGTLALLPPSLQAQNIESSLERLAEENAERFVEPVFEGLGSALSSGWVHSARLHGPLGFDIGVRVMGALIPDDRNTFNASPPSSVTFEGRTYSNNPYESEGDDLRTPTAVGEGTGIVLRPRRGSDFEQDILLSGQNPDDFRLPFPDGLDVPAIPFIVLQGSVGVGFGTELGVRLIPSIEVHEDVGSVGAVGFSVKHSINHWIPGPFPVDLSVLAGWQSFSVGDYLDASSATLGVIGGKSFGPLSVYALGSLESPSVDLSYTVSNPDGNPGLPADGTFFGFSPDLGTNPRLGAGVTLDLVLFHLSAGATIGEYNTVTAKAGFSFR